MIAGSRSPLASPSISGSRPGACSCRSTLVRWPVAGIVTALLAAIVWWIIEAGFAWLLAMWETEHEQIARDRGLPRAELVRRRKK